MKKLLFSLMLTAAVSSQAYSQITYHDIVPDTTVDTWNTFAIPFANNATLLIWYHPGEVSVRTYTGCEILFDAGGALPLKLNAGDSIAPSGKYKEGNYDVLSDGATGNWVSNATDKYLGFRVKNGTVWNYGWMKLTVNGAISFTAKEWAYNTLGGKINAGQKTVTTGIATTNNEDNIGIALQGKNLRFANLDAVVPYQVTVYNTQGQPVQKADIHAADAVDMSNAAPGVYVVQLSANGYTRGFKIAIP